MMLSEMGALHAATDGLKGFDANTPISATVARQFAGAGYGFAVRYVGRRVYHGGDLTSAEAADILAAGLGLMVVQHVESAESWTPDEGKGVAYGQYAALRTNEMGLPPGTMIWCDLEGVAHGVAAGDVTAYCNAWHRCVAGAGFLPGLYVGWRCGLSAAQLYRLRYTHYWAAYNLDDDEMPAVRGVQMRQGECRTADRVAGCAVEFDVNRVQADRLGGRPVIFAPLATV